MGKKKIEQPYVPELKHEVFSFTSAELFLYLLLVWEKDLSVVQLTHFDDTTSVVLFIVILSSKQEDFNTTYNGPFWSGSESGFSSLQYTVLRPYSYIADPVVLFKKIIRYRMNSRNCTEICSLWLKYCVLAWVLPICLSTVLNISCWPKYCTFCWPEYCLLAWVLWIRTGWPELGTLPVSLSW